MPNAIYCVKFLDMLVFNVYKKWCKHDIREQNCGQKHDNRDLLHFIAFESKVASNLTGICEGLYQLQRETVCNECDLTASQNSLLMTATKYIGLEEHVVRSL